MQIMWRHLTIPIVSLQHNPRYVFGLHPICNELDVMIALHALDDGGIPIVYKPICSLRSLHSIHVDAVSAQHLKWNISFTSIPIFLQH